MRNYEWSHYMMWLPGSKGRIPLGIHHAGERYIITEDKEGRVILEKAVLMPERGVWLHKNVEGKKSVLRGLKQAKQMRLKSNIIDLDEMDSRSGTRIP